MTAFPAARVLVPVDFSEASARAFAWAKAVAAPGARVDVLYARDIPPAPMLGMPIPPLTAAARRILERRLKREYPGAHVHVEEGDPVVLITRAARRSGLVVAGSHGRVGIDRAVLGSVSEAVVRDSPVPVLVGRTPPKSVTSVLAPVNLTPYSKKGLALAAEAAAFFGAELAILHVSADKAHGSNPNLFVQEFLAGLRPDLRRALKPRLIRRAGEPVKQILAESRRHGLLVLTAHRKSLLADLVLGMTAERIVRHCRIPVLTAPSGKGTPPAPSPKRFGWIKR